MWLDLLFLGNVEGLAARDDFIGSDAFVGLIKISRLRSSSFNDSYITNDITYQESQQQQHLLVLTEHTFEQAARAISQASRVPNSSRKPRQNSSSALSHSITVPSKPCRKSRKNDNPSCRESNVPRKHYTREGRATSRALGGISN